MTFQALAADAAMPPGFFLFDLFGEFGLAVLLFLFVVLPAIIVLTVIFTVRRSRRSSGQAQPPQQDGMPE